MARINNGEELKFTTEIVLIGDWNRGKAEKAIGKPITRVYFNNNVLKDSHIVMAHNDLLTLLEGYILADIMSIELIKAGKSGDVKAWETPLVEKVQKMLDYYKEVK